MRVAGISRQAYSQSKLAKKQEEQSFEFYQNLIHEMRAIHPGMGLRTMYEITRPEGIGRDAFIALGHSLDLQIVTHKSPIRTTYSTKSNRYPNLLGERRFTDVNQVWSSDITYFQIHNTTYYLVFILDIYSRRIVGWSAEKHMRAESNLAALTMAFATRNHLHFGDKLIHHSDRGGQYVSHIYTNALEKQGVLISMCREVYENAHIERVNGTIKNQYLEYWKSQISDLKALKKCLHKAVNAYNTKRPHKALNGLSPIQFEQQLLNIPMVQRKIMTIFTISNPNKNVTHHNSLQLKFSF